MSDLFIHSLIMYIAQNSKATSIACHALLNPPNFYLKRTTILLDITILFDNIIH